MLLSVILNTNPIQPWLALANSSSHQQNQANQQQQQNDSSRVERAQLNQLSGALDKSECQSDHEEQLYVTLTTFWYLFLASITAAGLLISLVSNMIIIYLVGRSLRRNPSNIIAANLSFSDLLYCIQWPSVIYTSITQSTSFLERAYVPTLQVCQTLGFITVSTALASILTVLAMSVERAIVIRYSIHAKNRFTIRLAWLVTILIWFISLAASIPPLFGKFNRYTLDPSKTSCTLEYLSHHTNYKLYILFLYVTFWIVPFVIITISYVLIISTFKKSSLSLEKVNACKSSFLSDQGHIRVSQLDDPLHFRADRWHRYLRDSVRSSLAHWRFNSTATSRLQACIAKGQCLYPVNQRRVASKNQQNQPVPISKLRKFTSSTSLDSPPFAAILLDPNNPSSDSHVKHTKTDSSIAPEVAQTQPSIASSYAHRLVSRQACRPSELHRSQTFHFLPARDIARHVGVRDDGVASSPARFFNHLLPMRRTSNNVHLVNHAARPNSHLIRNMLQFRLARMSFYLIVLWLVSWTPIASLAMINSVINCHRASATAVFMASTMTKLGPTFDVFIYGVSHPKIKSKFKQIIKWLLTFGTRYSKQASQELDCYRVGSCPRLQPIGKQALIRSYI